MTPYNGLANRRLQPLGHLSGDLVNVCQLKSKRKRLSQRLALESQLSRRAFLLLSSTRHWTTGVLFIYKDRLVDYRREETWVPAS